MRYSGLILAIVIPVIGILPMFGGGLANGADAPFHAHRIFALARLIEAGDLYPRWAPYFHLGYGYPVFNYYAPGATHIGAWLHLLGFDVISAYTLTTALAWCLGSVGVWLLARAFLPASLAALACILWVYAPSRFFEFWWQGSLAQIVSTSFIPFVFYGIARVRRLPNLRNSLWIALPFAAIVLTHTPTTYVVSLFLLPFGLAAAFGSGSRRAVARRLFFMGCGLLVGAGLSAIFWLPVAAELQYVKIGGELPGTVDFLKQSFLDFDELISLPRIIDSNDATLLMARTLGPIGALLGALGALALIVRRRIWLALILITGLIAAIVLTMELSLDVWLALPGLRNLRFPERIIRMAALLIALLGASSPLLFPLRWRMPALLLLSALAIGQALPLMRPRDDDIVWTALSAQDEIEMEFAERNWGTTAYNEFRPVWGSATSFDLPKDLESYRRSPLRIRVYAPDFERQKDRLSYQYQAENQILIAVSGDEATIKLRQFYMPGWQLTVDGESHPLGADEQFGLVQAQLPGGEHLLRLDYAGTSVQHLAAAISLASVGACIFIVWSSRPSQRMQTAAGDIPARATLLAGGGLIAFAVFNSAWLQENAFRIIGEDGEPAYMQREAGVAFDDAVTLLGYTLESDAVSHADPLDIRLYWRQERAPNAEYQPVVQLIDLTGAEAWAVSQPLNFEGGKISALPPGKFMSDGHSLKLFDDVPAFVGRVSVQLIRQDDASSRAELSDGSNRYLLPEAVRIEGPFEAFRGRSRAIDFGGNLTLHCIETRRTADEFTGILHWEVLEKPSRNLHHFVHGLDEDGTLVAQNDGEPLEGQYPTSLWRKGQHIRSAFSLALGEGVARVAFGLYDPADGKRIQITVDGGATDRILLALDNTVC